MSFIKTSTKGTMDPEGARLLTYCTICQQAQRRALCCSRPLRCTLRYTHCAGSVLPSIMSI